MVEPKTGEHFFYELTHLNSQCFQIFLELVSEYFADSMLSWIWWVKCILRYIPPREGVERTTKTQRTQRLIDHIVS